MVCATTRDLYCRRGSRRRVACDRRVAILNLEIGRPAMAKLTGDLRVGVVRFHEGVDLATVQAAIDRLYARIIETRTDNDRLESLLAQITEQNHHPEI